MVRLTKRLAKAVDFARWCIREKIEPLDAARLMALAHAVFLAGVREANGTGDAGKQRRQFETMAKHLGYQTDWPGLAPTLKRKGFEVYLPEGF